MRRHRAADVAIFILISIATTASWGCGLEADSGDELPATARAAECEPRDHDLGNGIVLRACDDQLIDADEAAMILEASASGQALPEQEQDITPPASALLMSQMPVDCRWYNFDTSSRSAMLTCPQGRHVVAGGCATTRMLNVSAPWENFANDPPDNGEFWDDVDITNGWLCEQSTLLILPPPRMIVSALCCLPYEEDGGEL